jgi:hypothetical protein
MLRVDLSPMPSSRIIVVEWEHEPILWIEPLHKKATVVLAHDDVVRQGTFFPPQRFQDQYQKLRSILQRCKNGELSFQSLLHIVGLQDDERLKLFSEIEYKLL